MYDVVAARELFIGGLKIIISITTNNFYLDFYNSLILFVTTYLLNLFKILIYNEMQ